MPAINPATAQEFGTRVGTHGEVLLWIVARNRLTGQPATIGLWSGDDHREFVVEGETRTYFGAGNVIQVPPIRAVTGLGVILHSVTLPPFTDEMRQALIQYDPRLAPAQLHSVPFSIDTNEPLQDPIRFVKGTIQQAPTTLGLKRSTASNTTIKIASNSRRLTEGLPIHRALDAHQTAHPGDLGRAHKAVASDWPIVWGDD